MKLNEAKAIAESIKAQLSPHCERCEIAGSIRRQKPEVTDIDIVLIPKHFDVGFLGMLEEGIAIVLKQWPPIHGTLKKGAGHLTYQLPEGIKLDLFFAEPDNFGVVLAHRTGSIAFAIKFKEKGKKLGYTWSHSNLLMNDKVVPVPDEDTLFEILKIPYTPPFFRK